MSAQEELHLYSPCQADLGESPVWDDIHRCKSGTLSSRYRSNGYVLGVIQDPGRLSGRHGSKLPSLLRDSVTSKMWWGLPHWILAVLSISFA